MNGSNFMQGWATFAGSLAIIALILTAFGLMLGIVKPADVPKRIGAILGIVIVLIFIPSILVSAWSGMSLWQQIAFIVIGIGAFRWLSPRRHSGNKK
jgi:membrane-anchored protein YejM (alkaline phosphatase superfamily)